MGRKRMPGLTLRGEIWHINKKIDGRRLYESTGTNRLDEAEKYLVRKLETIRQAKVYGIRPKRTFKEAATKFLLENQHKKSIHSDNDRLKFLVPIIGNLPLDTIHMGTLQTYIEARRRDGIKTRTINHGLQVVRRIVNLAAHEWIDENSLSWLLTAPKIKLLPEPDLRKPYPLNWDEQDHLFSFLSSHLKEMALFAVNTGCRDQEICQLRWEWEMKVPDQEIGSVFIVPGNHVKNEEDRLIVLNHIAKAVIERQRGKHPEFVFVYRDKPITRMLNKGWLNARKKADLVQVRVHDLKHTFGRRLRAAGISFEDRQDLLGHKSSRITTHYSAAELKNLWKAANTVVVNRSISNELVVLRTAVSLRRVKVA